MTSAAVCSQAPRVTIVGRPNVGKSTLFNRLLGRRSAIVADNPGVTRDRNESVARWRDRVVRLVDTGGFEERASEGMLALVSRQSRQAIAESDVVVLVLDGRAGISPADREAVSMLRRTDTPVVYAINKIDTPRHETLACEFSSLGVAPMHAISAEHARGIGGLVDDVLARLPSLPGQGGEGKAEKDPDRRHAAGPGELADPTQEDTRLAIVGRPNVGKSSLLNRMLGYERAIVDGDPGTTRDPIGASVSLAGRRYVLVDTAGIRRRSRVAEGVERHSVGRSLRSIDQAQIVLLVLDAHEGMTDQDARIATYAWRQGRAMALLINKWDLVAPDGVSATSWTRGLRDRWPAIAGVPALCVSAKTGWRVELVHGVIRRIDDELDARLPTPRLNQVLRAAVGAHSPRLVRGSPTRLFYAAQIATRPPTVAVFVSDPARIEKNYLRYLQSQFAEAFGVHGVPVKLEFRRRH